MVRIVTFPKLEPEDCASCKVAPSDDCIEGCKGTGKIPPLTPLWVLSKTLNPTKEEMEGGGGVDMAQMVLNYPIVKSIKEADGNPLFLTQDQWEHLQTRINVTKWLGHNDQIYLICQAVLDAEDKDAKDVEHLNRETKRKYEKDERDGKRGPGRPRKTEPEAEAGPIEAGELPVAPPAAEPAQAPLAPPADAPAEPIGLPA